MTRILPPLEEAWADALARYASVAPPNYVSDFNIDLLRRLHSRWGTQLRVNTSMFRLLFTRPDEHHYDESTLEWAWVPDDVQMGLMRRSHAAASSGPLAQYS